MIFILFSPYLVLPKHWLVDWSSWLWQLHQLQPPYSLPLSPWFPKPTSAVKQFNVGIPIKPSKHRWAKRIQSSPSPISQNSEIYIAEKIPLIRKSQLLFRVWIPYLFNYYSSFSLFLSAWRWILYVFPCNDVSSVLIWKMPLTPQYDLPQNTKPRVLTIPNRIVSCCVDLKN